MAEQIFIGVAWPYANGPLHLGHIAGAYLPADILARYHRMKGSEVLLVSGSDQHGTPITVRAEQEGKNPGEVAEYYHQQFLRSLGNIGISFDLFTRTGTDNHREVTHDFFLALLKKGHIYKDTMQSPYCPRCLRFLPDRYVEGTCPFCHFDGARGDQCDECGKPLNPADLIDPRCKICGSGPQIRDTEHFFLRLTAFTDQLLSWVKAQTHWRPNVQNFTARFLEDGLKDRAITRDIEWGVSVPVPGAEQKRIYVWFEAVIGYLSASKEWAVRNGDPEAWRKFWQDPTKAYYFIGKDNIPFHTIIWPAMLLGYGDLVLPYDVPANEFLTLEGRQFSTSRNWAVWLDDYLGRYDPDPLRYYLSINMPQTGDADFSWAEFVRRNNDELVATWGNLVHRVLTFNHRHFGKHVPTPKDLDQLDNDLLRRAEEAHGRVGDKLLHQCSFREAIREAFGLAQATNQYLEERAPWKIIHQDPERAATTVYVALSIINILKVMLYPFLPFSSQKLHHILGFDGEIRDWTWTLLTPGQKLGTPAVLFIKLDEKVAEEERARFGESH
ncbi:MAG: methionine--tRNA ligase [Chloroflexi bacterium]|nr:methionine--tRNA ligase [Chloroflexota bacterium]